MSTILIAYEREAEAAMLNELLAGRGHTVIRSANGIEALDIARRDPPDLVLSDILLPKMDGFALCRKWKQDARLQSIPFVFFTTRHDDPKYERFAEELHADRFLARPSEPDALINAVDELLAMARTSGTGTERLPVLDEANVRLSARVLELQAENRQLAEVEAAYRGLFASSPAPQWITDPEARRHLLVNESALELLGYTRDEFLEAPPEALEAPPGSPAVPDEMKLLRRKDGHPLVVLRDTRTLPFRGRSAEASVACDLTETAERLEHMERELKLRRAIEESLPGGFLLVDADGKVLDANNAYCKFSGFTKKELLKRSLADLEVTGPGGSPARHRDKSGKDRDIESAAREVPGHSGLRAIFVHPVVQEGEASRQQQLKLRQFDALVGLHRMAEDLDDHAFAVRGLGLAAALLESPLALILDVSEDGKEAAVFARARVGEPPEDRAPGRFGPLGRTGPWSQAVKTGESAILNPVKSQLAIDGVPELERCIVVPLTGSRESRGLLVVANRHGDYSNEDKVGLESFAGRIWEALAAKRAHLLAMRELQRADVARETFLMALVRMLDVHDPYAAGSATRVAALAVAIARELGVDSGRQESIRLAAILHDIGSVQMPQTILGKPGPLTEQEMALVKTHPGAGRALLDGIDFRAPVGEIIEQHHERLDGSGYPGGLKGEAILFESRIVAVADVIEAMCSNRAHRQAPGIDAALEEIGQQSGRLYDAKVVAACTRLFRQHGFRFPS